MNLGDAVSVCGRQKTFMTITASIQEMDVFTSVLKLNMENTLKKIRTSGRPVLKICYTNAHVMSAFVGDGGCCARGAYGVMNAAIWNVNLQYAVGLNEQHRM